MFFFHNWNSAKAPAWRCSWTTGYFFRSCACVCVCVCWMCMRALAAVGVHVFVFFFFPSVVHCLLQSFAPDGKGGRGVVNLTDQKKREKKIKIIITRTIALPCPWIPVFSCARNSFNNVEQVRRKKQKKNNILYRNRIIIAKKKRDYIIIENFDKT